MESSYRLLDSGEGARLEQFGEITLVRPSKFAVWKRRFPELWKKASARYEHKRGWEFSGKRFEEWECGLAEFSLILRLQDNGQIGLFPEHAGYLPQLVESLKAPRVEAPQVLNLFAYTGLATISAAMAGAKVTHVDLSKKVLEWAQKNFELNGVKDVRFIKEDALAFLRKEVKRGKKYDVVIADPPSFSRIAPREEWNLEEVLSELLSLCVALLRDDKSALFCTSHHFESGGHVMGNLIKDLVGEGREVKVGELSIKEEKTKRELPAGFLVEVR